MERKIGEIFEYNGEWYQCIIGHCNQCSFDEECSFNEAGICKFIGNSYCAYRNDKKLACFKKLEKVGEPFTSVGKLYQYYKVFDIDNVCGDGFWCVHNYKAKTLTIEIKQTKEDNRTINQHFAECEQTINDAVRKCYTENKSTQVKDKEEYKMNDVKEDIAEFDKINDECLFGKQELKLKPFDLESAKAGKPVCTRDGRKVRIICFNAKRKDERNIIALVPSKDFPGFEDLIPYPNNGNYCGGHENDGDLMMLPEKKEGWVNVYKGGLLDTKSYPTKKEAFDKACPEGYVDTVKVCWEE